MTKRILAIDPGSKEVGLYWGPGLSKTLYLIDQRLSASKQAKVTRAERLGLLAEKLADFLMEENFDFAVYEEQFVRGDAATRALYGAVGVLEAVLTSSAVGVMSVPQSTIRKWANQNVKAAIALDPKALYFAAARGLDGSTKTEHEHDACVLWHFIQAQGEF